MSRPNKLVLVEPSVRTWLDWTPDRIKLAERMADSGNLRLAGELCDAMLADDRVSGCLSVRARGLLGLELDFEKGAGRRKARAVKFLEAQEDWDTAYPVSQLAQLNLWGIFLGVGVGQNLWTESPTNGRVVPVLDPWHPRHLRYDAQTDQWHLLTLNSGEIAITPGDGKWILYTPGGVKRPWSHGAWKACARWWLLKKYAQDDWARQTQNAAGIKSVESPPLPAENDGLAEKRKLNKTQLALDLEEMGSRGSIVLPPGYKLSIVSQQINSFETFNKAIDAANTGIAIAIAGQNLTSEVQGGSYAAAEVHRNVAGVLLAADASTLATCLHDQALTWWSTYNLGDPSHAPWPFWDTTPPADLSLQTKTWLDAATAATNFQKLADDRAMLAPGDQTDDGDNFDVDLKALAEMIGLPIMKRIARPVPVNPVVARAGAIDMPPGLPGTPGLPPGSPAAAPAEKPPADTKPAETVN